MIRDRGSLDTAHTATAARAPTAQPLSGRTMRTLLARAKAGDTDARRLLIQRVGETAGNAATVATAPPPPCNLTATTVVPVAGDMTDDEALAATQTLPAFVQDGNDGGHQLTTDCRRREFMRWAREWFGTYRAAIAHYAAMDHATGVPGSPVVAAQVAPRLQAVATEMGADMPSTTTAFSFRRAFAGAHPAGTSMHTLGYALDYDATLMPRIGRDETALLIELVTGGKASAQILDYGRRRAAIKRMGDRTAGGTAATQGDATAQTVITTLNSELTRIAAGSTTFQGALGAHTADFLELRTQYFEADAAHRPAILAQVAPLLQPFFAAITTAEAAPDIQAPRQALLASLRAKLNDPVFLFGSALRPRAPRARRGEPAPPTPRPGTAMVVDTPSLAQLIEHGWFNPGTGGAHWGARFAESMARHGFEGGFAWGGASQDSMHFELVVDRPFTPPAAPAASGGHH
jgi:hypothetical protein